MSDGKPQVIDILVVEDNDDDIFLIRESFEEARLANLLDIVVDGEEAMAYLRREPPFVYAKRPGLILLDINMPKMNGFEVLAEMKNDPALRSIPVLVLTTSSREEDVVRSYDYGACSFITKPVTVDKLQEVLNELAVYWALVARVPKSEQS